MRYNQIRECDIANGESIGIALFVQGCHFKCKNCFNPETWDFDGGKEWTKEIKEKFLELASKPYIKRISLLGGECLTDENLDDVLDLVCEIRKTFPNKTIWLYTGYQVKVFELQNSDHTEIEVFPKSQQKSDLKRAEIISKCDVIVDGRFEEDKKDITLKWRGSRNQRVINVKESLERGEVILWTS